MDRKKIQESPDAILRERKNRIFSLKTLILFAASSALAVFLLAKLDIAKMLNSIRNANMFLIAASCLTYFISIYFKTLRLSVMLRKDGVPITDLYTITSYHNFFNQIMPARTGELTFVYYLKKIGGVGMTKGLHVLVVIRIYDFIVISAFFICSVILYFGARMPAGLVVAGLCFLILSVVVLFNLKWIVARCGALFRFAVTKLRMHEKKIIGKILGKIDAVVDEFSSFKTGRSMPMLAATSILIWSALYFLFYLTIRSFGVHIDPVQSVVGSTGGVLTNVLPINSFGSFGTLEAGWTGGFIMAGMSQHDAIFTGFGYHAISLFASAAAALFCYGVTKLRKK